jgi:hypothetical protein
VLELYHNIHSVCAQKVRTIAALVTLPSPETRRPRVRRR